MLICFLKTYLFEYALFFPVGTVMALVNRQRKTNRLINYKNIKGERQ